MSILNQALLSDLLYKQIESDAFAQVDDNVYILEKKDDVGDASVCMVVLGDISDSVISSFHNKVDCLISLPPKDISSPVEGSLNEHSSPSTHINADKIPYTQATSEAKSILLKPGHFLVEFLPEENGDNYEYIYRVKDLARKAGFEYYARVPWKKGDFVANTGRKSKNTEDICFFSKGRARDLRPDAKKDKAEPGVEHFMSGAAGMLPTVFDVAPTSKKDKIHHAEKPVELLRQILRFVTKEDEIALDQFAGSGVLGEAALLEHRDSILIEKDLATYNTLRARIEALDNVKVTTEVQRETLHVAVDALEAVHDGPEATAALAAFHAQKGTLLVDAYQDMRNLAFSEDVSGEQSEILQDACEALEVVYDAAQQPEQQPIREEGEALSDLRDKLTARIEALINAPVATDAQKEAIQVAIGALKAAYDGVEVMESYAEHQNSHGMRLSEAFHALSDIPVPSTDNALQDAIKAASETIEAADLHKEMSSEKAEPEKKVLECSIRGDRRFSSLFAKVTINGRERSIEEWFQDAKRTADGKKAGKGKPFDYIVDPFTGDKLPGSEAQWMYRGLWITYFAKNPELVKYAEQFDEFTNCFNKYRDPDSEEDLPRGPGQFNLTRLESSVEEVIGAYVKGDRDRYVAVVKASNWYKNMARKREHPKKPALDAKIQDAHARQAEQDKPAEQMSLFPRGGFNHGI